MIKKRVVLNLVLWSLLLGSLAACGDNPAEKVDARPTPTLLVARFRTATPAPAVAPITPVPPTPTPRPPVPTPTPLAPTETATPLPQPTAEVLPAATATATATATAAATATATPAEVEAVPDTPTPTPVPVLSTPAGRIAFPIDDGGGHYDIWVIEVPDGQPFLALNRARQPNFSSQGQLLVNNEQSPQGENIGLLDSNYTFLGLVSDAPEDSHPSWSPDGSRYVFANPIMLLDPLTQNHLPYLFIPCTLRRPVEEQDLKCQDTRGQSKLVPGTYPVWTDDNLVAHFGYSGNDGLYVVSAWNTPRESRGGLEAQLVLSTSDARPSDSRGNRLYFSSSTIDGNWEAYAVNLDGSDLANLSNSPESQDGLPTASPDGQWVAFVSDRAGPWGIFILPASGGTPELLLDLSSINTNPSPWGAGDHDWTNERITWGP